LPQITAEGSNVYVVWQDNTTGNYDVFFKTSFDNGIKFKSTRNLSKNNGTSELPQIATHNNSMYVVWNDNSGDSSSIFFKNGRKDSSASNAEFGSLTKLRSFGNASYPRLVAGENFFPSVWTSNSDKLSVINFYLLNLRDDSDSSIQMTKLVPKGTIRSVDIFGNDNYAYCVWQNNEIPNGDIFFKRMGTIYFD